MYLKYEKSFEKIKNKFLKFHLFKILVSCTVQYVFKNLIEVIQSYQFIYIFINTYYHCCHSYYFILYVLFIYTMLCYKSAISHTLNKIK